MLRRRSHNSRRVSARSRWSDARRRLMARYRACRTCDPEALRLAAADLEHVGAMAALQATIERGLL